MTDFEYVVRLSNNADSKRISLLLREMFEDRGVTPSRDQPFQAENGMTSCKFWCYVACEASSGNVVGFCLFYNSYSTWYGVSLFISDIFVQEGHRRRGLCRSLIQAVLNHDTRRCIRRLDTQVPQSSNVVIKVLEKLNFENISSSMGWLEYILSGPELQNIADAKLPQGISVNENQKDCDIHIRPSTSADAPVILRLIHDLASWQDFGDRVENETDIISRDLEDGFFISHLAFDVKKNTAVGHVLSYFTLSAEHGSSFHVEDLFVHEAYRGRGIGRALMETSCKIAIKMGAESVVLQVLDTNSIAKRVYQNIGFVNMCDSTPVVNYRLQDRTLEALKVAERSPRIDFA